MNFSGKGGHPSIRPSTRPGIEPGTSGLGGRDLYRCANPSAMFDSFYTKPSKNIGHHAPIKKIPRKEQKLRSKPWITLAFSYYHLKFKYYRNRLNHLLKVSKKQYYNDYFHANRSNPKKIWTGIKRIITLRPKCNHAPKKINNNNTDITEPKAIANAFNNFFAKIGNDIANSVRNTDFSPQRYLNKQTYDTFYLLPTSTSEIEAEISAINVRKATGPYSIPSNLLKLLKSVISRPLEFIFLKCILCERNCP